jgi:hypothetical protein
MTRQIINVGTADKGNGDPIRTAFIKANANFAELYNILSNNTGGSIITTDIIGSVFADDSTLLVDGINGSIPYSVLSGAPTIPAAQVQSNWTASSGMGVILNKPTLFSGSYTDLTSKPTIPTLVSQLANDSGFLTSISNISNIRSEGNINIDINLSDSTLRRWQFGEDGILTLPSVGKISNGAYDWTFGTDGKLTAPGNLQVNGGKIILNTGGNAYVESVDYGVNSANSAVNIFGGPYQKIKLRAGFGTEATWTFATDGELALPNNGKITSGVDAAQVGSTTTIALNSLGTDQANNNINVGIEWTGNEAVFTTYAAGSTITFANGDVRTITEIQKNEVYGEPGVFAIDIYWSTGTPRENLTAFPITLKTSNYVAAYTAPEWTFGTDGSLTLPADIASHSWIEPAGNTLSLYKRTGNASSHVTQTAIKWQSIVLDQDTGNWPAYAAIYAELPTIDTPAVSISARQGTSGNTSQWVFGADGKLVLSEIGTLSNGGHDWTFGTDGSLTFPDATVQSTAWTGFSVAADDSTQRSISSGELVKFIGAGGVTTASDAEGNITITGSKVIGSWTVTTGTSTYSFTLPSDGTYVMWVKGNIANGIITWNATASVTNTNVPAIGSQYAWNYTGGGSPILLTAIPDQIRGSAGTISTDNTYAGSTSNRFDFGISNTSGASQTVYYGYTKIS